MYLDGGGSFVRHTTNDGGTDQRALLFLVLFACLADDELQTARAYLGSSSRYDRGHP